MAKDTFFYKKKTINCNGQLLFLDEPIIMGILNLTPDSFFDGGSYTNEKQIVTKAEQLLNEGATILDLGAYSSKPNASNVTEQEELSRLIPALKSIVKAFPKAIISVDTFRSNVAQMAIEHGASIINDISAGNIDSTLYDTVAKLKAPYIMMHMQGTPQTMQQNPTYNNVVDDVSRFFSEKINKLTQLGVNDIILDPGFGFGKTVEHNYTLMNHLNHFWIFNLPILVGISRKSMVCKVINQNPENALNGTTTLHTIALLKNADILRVHDVKEAMEAIKIVKQLKMT